MENKSIWENKKWVGRCSHQNRKRPIDNRIRNRNTQSNTSHSKEILSTRRVSGLLFGNLTCSRKAQCTHPRNKCFSKLNGTAVSRYGGTKGLPICSPGVQVAPKGVQMARQGVRMAPNGIQMAPKGIQMYQKTSTLCVWIAGKL